MNGTGTDPNAPKTWSERAAKARRDYEENAVVDPSVLVTLDNAAFHADEKERYKADHLHACGMIADMHAAAVGEITGPRRGVVEDVADLRAERDQLRRRLAQLALAAERLAVVGARVTNILHCTCIRVAGALVSPCDIHEFRDALVAYRVARTP